jgi:hypothetical protein
LDFAGMNGLSLHRVLRTVDEKSKSIVAIW